VLLRRLLLPVLAAVAVGGCGGGDRRFGEGTLVWAKPPALVRASNLATDRVLLGTIRNNSLRPLSLTASKLRVRDARGREVTAFAQFAASYAHGLYGAYQRPDPLPEEELRRLGLVLRLDPGKTAPLAVSFRMRRGLAGPLSVDYGQGVLPIPARALTPARPR
jgi:hypothetical protein